MKACWPKRACECWDMLVYLVDMRLYEDAEFWFIAELLSKRILPLCDMAIVLSSLVLILFHKLFKLLF